MSPLSLYHVESKRERMKKLNCLSIQREGKLRTDIWKREKENPMLTAKAGAQCRVPVPGPPPCHGGRRDWWGQARPMGTVSHRPLARARQHQTLEKPPAQIPSQHSPFGPRLSRQTKPNKQSLRSSSEFQIPLNPNPKKIQAYSINPNTQSETKEIQKSKSCPWS